MAQRVDVNGTIVEFPDGMSQEAMAAALTKLPKPAQAPTEPSVSVPVAAAPMAAPVAVDDQTGPAFTYAKPFRRDEALKARAATVKAEEAAAIPFESVYTDPANLQKIMQYGESRFGKSGKPEQGESLENYVKRFMTHMRMLSTGNEISSTQELQYLNSVKDEDKLKAKEAYDLFDKTAGYFSDKGQKGIKPVLDVLGSIISSPTTALSLGAGKIATSAFTKEATKAGVKQATKATAGRLAAVPAIESAGAAASDTLQQKIALTGEAARLKQLEVLLPTLSEEDQTKFAPEVDELRKKVEAGVSGGRVAVAAVLGGVLGTAETAALIKGGTSLIGKGSVGELDEILKQRATKTTELPKVEVPEQDSTMKALEDSFDIFEGRKLLNKEGEPTSVAEMQVRNDVNQKAAQVAKEIWTRVPELAPVEGQKISDAIKNVYMSIDKIDNIVLEDSLAQAGITAQEFAQMNRTTIGDAGRTLQALSVLSRIQNKLKSIDKEAAKEVDDMYGNRNALVDSFSGLYSGAQRLDRELKALMVSQVSTTLRNGYSTGSIVTIGAASEAIESVLYRVGKSAVEVSTGKPVTGTFTGGMKAVYDDAVRTTFYLGQQGLSSDVAEALLASSPALRDRILKTTGESGTETLSVVGRYANTLNTAQDAFFRKAIFVSNVDKQLSRVGLNMYDILAQNKNVPFDVLNNATEEALAATMSKMPTKGPMFYGVKFIESIPILGSTIAPFPRFMANALTWSYKHSPFNALNGSIDVARGSSLLKQGDDSGNAYLSRGLENVSKSMVGTAAIYAAYKYRKEHQDTAWYDQEGTDGSRVDIRAFWPFGPFMAMGDWLVKFENGRTDEFKTGELLEAISGFKAPAGTYAWLGDKFTEAASKFANSEESDNQKLSTFFGEWAGEYFGRALIPAAQLSDIIGAIDRDETLPRDAYQIPKGEEGFVSSATQQLTKRIPVAKQQLPVYQPALREEAQFNDAGPLKMLSGVAVKGKPNEIEAEVERLKIDFRKVFSSTGDKVIDAAARGKMAALVADNFGQLQDTDYYQTLSKDGQKIVLQNFLSWAQRTAKETAIKEDMAAANEDKDQSRIFSVQYDKLPPEVKRETAALYKEQTGEDLNVTKDYMSALAMAKAIRSSPKFATGGLAGDIAGKVLGTAVKKSSTDLLKEMQDAALRKAVVPEAAPVVSQAIKATPVVKKPMAVDEPTPMPAAPEAPMARQMEEAMPTPAAAAEPAPMPNLVEDLQPAAKQIDEAMPATGGFTPEQYAAGEKLMAENYTPEFVKSWKIANYDDYMSTAHSYTGQAAGVKWNEMPPNPFMKQADDSAASLTDEVPYGDDKYLLSEPEPLVKPRMSEDKAEQILTGDLNKQVRTTSTTQRNNIIAEIKNKREDSFFRLRDNMDFATVDDEVLGTLLGEYRAKTGNELSPKNPEQLAEAKAMATQLQTKLEQLREKYKAVPPVRLYHGNTTEKIDSVKKTGFFDPSQYATPHAEMYIGAPSFTKDLNLGFNANTFGGRNPENYIYTDIPYADYMFSRINMSTANYDKKDMNTIIRAITGAPDVVRPISLPRAGFNETEDMMLEANKLRVKGRNPTLKGVSTDRKFSNEQFNQALTGIKTKAELVEDRDVTRDYISKAVDAKNPKEAAKLAYMSYTSLRDLMNSYMNMSKGAVRAGTGQQYQSTIDQMADTVGIVTELPKIADILDGIGAKQKAQNVRQLREVLSEFSATDAGYPATARAEAKRKDALQKVREITPKLAKGGLATRR